MLYGVGITDVDYVVNKCPFYLKWQQMLRRCYCIKYKLRRPNLEYKVCKEWLVFSNFKQWMESQDWVGKELDKDLLVTGNRLYSPDTCLLVTNEVNSFINEIKTKQSSLPTGSYRQYSGKIAVKVKCWKSGYRLYVGTFDSEQDALKAWRETKHNLACRLADLQTNERVADALRNRYKDDANTNI